MSDIHPSILNQMRRNELDKDPERNIIPAQQRVEAETPTEEGSKHERALTSKLGRLATKLNLIGGAGGP